MAENLIEELIMEEIKIKEEEEVFIKEEICSSSSLEETCTWDMKKMLRWKIHKAKVKIRLNKYFILLTDFDK